ncbi:MAG: hypothetical protein IIV62_03385, partial [Anaerotignum sp.]|nr:hypothetical protein [Anaerotignum sp.]
MKKIRSNRKKRINLRSMIACVTALSVVMGSSYFALADDAPVYICGYTEQHAHGASCYGDKLICTTPEKLVYTCGQVDNGDGTVTYGAKTEHAHNLADCYTLACETPVGHVHDAA